MLTPTELRRREAEYDAQLDCDAAELARRRKQREADRAWRESVRRHHRWQDLSAASKTELERRRAKRENPLDYKIAEMLAADPPLSDRLWLNQAAKGYITIPSEHASPEIHQLYNGYLAEASMTILSFKKLEVETPAKPIKPRYLFETVSDLRSLPDATWLVDKWVPEQGVGIIYGKWAAGKSFVGFDLVLHLAYGMKDWHGVKLPGVACEVLIIAREGSKGFKSRIDAFKEHRSITDDTDRIVFMRSPVNFGVTAQFEELKTAIEATGRKFRCVLVDTVGRALPGEDMNSQDSITRFMEHLQQLGELSDGVAIGVHHENRSGGLIGSIYFENTADFIFHVERDGDPDKGEPLQSGVITCVKQKDGEDGWKRAVRFKPVGKSLVVERIGDVAHAPKSETLSDRQALALKALREAIYAKGELVNGIRAVTEDAWREEMFQRDIIKRDEANPRSAFRKIRDALARKQKIVSRNGYVHLPGIIPMVPLPPIPR